MWLNLIYTLLILIYNFHFSTLETFNDDEYLLFSNQTNIFKFDNRSKTCHSILTCSRDDSIKNFDLSIKDNLLFWINDLDHKINVFKINSSVKSRPIVLKDFSSPKVLAIDWITRKIYWIDSNPNRIEVSDYNGNNNSIIISLLNQVPQTLSLDPLNGLIFWSDCNNHGSIYKLSMDGNESTKKTIISKTCASSISIDYQNNNIFWSDFQSREILVSDYEGIKVLKLKSVFCPFLTVVKNSLIYNDFISKKVFETSSLEKTNDKLLFEFNSKLININYFSQSKQPFKNSSCLINNGGCSNLCLLSSISPFYSCACPHGLKILKDQKTCPSFPDNLIFFSSKGEIKYISLDTFSFLSHPMKIKVGKISSLNFDPIDQRFFYIEANQIKSSFMNGTDLKNKVAINSYYNKISLDIVNRNIYAIRISKEESDHFYSNVSIDLITMDFKYEKTLVNTYLNKPKSIAVDYINENFYLSDHGENPKIEKISFDLTKRKNIVKDNIARPGCLIVDSSINKLFWCDFAFNKIEVSDLDGLNQKTLLKLNYTSIHEMTLFEDFIYWVDAFKNKIGKVHKLTGKFEIMSNFTTKIENIETLKAISLTKYSNSLPNFNNNLNCSHIQISQKNCSCSNGFELDENKQLCKLGSNPCKNENICDHNCRHLIGSYYECYCNDGFILDQDKKLCIKRNYDLKNFTIYKGKAGFFKCKIKQKFCSHQCVLINNDVHCKCPDSMFLDKDTITCLFLNTKSEKLLIRNKSKNEIQKTEIYPEDNKLSIFDYIFLILFFVIIILVLTFFIFKNFNIEKKENLNYSFPIESHSNKNEKMNDFDLNLSSFNKTLSFYDRSITGASTVVDESFSLTDPPPSPNKQLIEYDENDLKSEKLDLKYKNLPKKLFVVQNEVSKSELDYFVPPPTPLFNQDNSLRSYSFCSLNSSYSTETIPGISKDPPPSPVTLKSFS